MLYAIFFLITMTLLARAADQKPNFVVLFMDDWGW